MGLSDHDEWLTVFWQFYVRTEFGESFCLKRVNGDHCLCIDSPHKIDDVIGVDVPARVDFDQVTIHVIELRLRDFPFLLLQITGPTGVEAPRAIRKVSSEVAVQHAGPEDHDELRWIRSDFIHPNPGRGHQSKKRFHPFSLISLQEEFWEENLHPLG